LLDLYSRQLWICINNLQDDRVVSELELQPIQVDDILHHKLDI